MLPSDKQARKNRPVFSGCLAYFPDALAEVAYVSMVGNAQHNGAGTPMHWSRDKSPDHADCVARHLLDQGKIDTDGLRHSAKVAWRALALLQIELEESAKLPPREQVIAEKLEAVFGEKPDSHTGTFTPLMYANTGTDAREPADGKSKRQRLEEQVAASLPQTYQDCASCPQASDTVHCCKANDPFFVVISDYDTAMKEDGYVSKEQISKLLDDHYAKAVKAKEDLDALLGLRPRPRVYISGPMRGIKDFNFPAFDEAAETLIASGWDVINPADIDRQRDRGTIQAPDVYVERDVDALLELARDNPTGQNGIYLLKGWANSVGASAEYAVAKWLGLEIHFQE